MNRYLVFGFIAFGMIAFLAVLLKHLLPDAEFRCYSKQEQRVYKFRRYVLLPIPFVALWPIITLFRILLHIEDRRAETRRAVKKMKRYIYSSQNNHIGSKSYDPEGRLIWPFDTLEGRRDQ